MHIDAAGAVLAGSRVFEDGAQLARGFGVVGIVIVGGTALTSRFGRGDPTKAAYGVPVLWWLIPGWICLCLAAVGLVMMAVGSG